MEFYGAAGPDPHKPSLFELVAQERLRDLLQPALKYVLAVFAQRYPRHLIKIVNRHEEFYALVMFLVERHYLTKHNASFSENFYGLKRRRKPSIDVQRSTLVVGDITERGRLRDKEIWYSLAFLVGIPYLRAKAHDYFEALGGGLAADVTEGLDRRQLQVSIQGRIRSAFKALYPYANTAFELWLLLWNITYLFDQSKTYRPWLSWIGIDIRRLALEDLQATELTGSHLVDSGTRQAFITRLYRLLLRSPRLVLDSLRLLLPTAIFFVKFLEWWYSPGSPARSLSISPKSPAIPPPSTLPPHPHGIAFDRGGYGVCPLCKKSIINATALPSGYVFCYRCAYDQVESSGICPITLLPARSWQLRKILV